MLPPISDERRRWLLQLAACTSAGAVARLFVTAPTSFSAEAGQLTGGASVSVPSVPDRLAFPIVDVGHDPFIPQLVSAQASVPSATGSPGGEIGIVLPPNAGAGADVQNVPATSGAPGIVVRAVVVGDSARALVEKNGMVNVVQVGDGLGGSTIAVIDAQGIQLASGIRLALAKDAQ